MAALGRSVTSGAGRSRWPRNNPDSSGQIPRRRLSLSILCVALSLTACAKDSPPSVAAKPGAQSSPSAAPPVAVACPSPAAPPMRAPARRSAGSTAGAGGLRRRRGATRLPRGGGGRPGRLRQRRRQAPDPGRRLRHLDADQPRGGKPGDGAPQAAGVHSRERAHRVRAAEPQVHGERVHRHRVRLLPQAACPIGEFNKQGIAVQYLAFPRMGLGSEDFKKMVSCGAPPTSARP